MSPFLESLAIALHRPFYGGRGSIICLHRVIPEGERSQFGPNRALEITPDDLDAMIEFLRGRGCEFIPTGDIAARLAKRGRKFVCFTLDDGYRDNLAHAAPVFRRHGVPFTVNITPGFTEHARSVWWYSLEDALAGDALEFSFGGNAERHSLQTPGAREAAFDRLAGRIRASAEPFPFIDAICAGAGVDPLRRTRELILDIAGVRELASEPLATIGAHTMNHLTSAVLAPDRVRAEFYQSKEWLQSLLCREVKHLAYPFGSRAAVGPRDFEIARSCGFETATTTRHGNIFRGHLRHLHALPRLEISGNYRAVPFLRRAESGLLPAMRNRWMRV